MKSKINEFIKLNSKIMRKKILLSAALIAVSFTSFAQVGVGTTSPDASAELDVTSTTKGFLPPRMTEAQIDAIVSPAEGLIVYCLDCYPKGVFVHNGTDFVSMETGTSPDEAIPALIDDATYPASGLTEDDFTNIGATGLVTANVAAYEAAIANANLHPSSDITDIQAIVNGVNNFVNNNAADIVISETGAIWMNKNLGASQVATGSNDAAAYGDHYQWGKNVAFTSAYDTSNNIAGPVANATEAGTNFVTNGTAPYDWITPANDFLWNSGTVSNPTKTAQDPCPTNYRVPTDTELNNELLAFSSNNRAGAYASTLKLPAAGFRHYSNGALLYVGINGLYWSSSISGTTARRLFFNSSNAIMSGQGRAYGFSVRCIKE